MSGTSIIAFSMSLRIATRATILDIEAKRFDQF